MFKPVNIGTLTLRNRIAMSAHFAGWWVDEGGIPSPAYASYLEERAKGGVGLFVIGGTDVERNGWSLENADDDIIPRYRMLVEAGHRHGTPVFAQLCHHAWYHAPPSRAKLKELLEAHVAATRRAVAGGVAGMELHSHESFFHAQMLNPLWNRRTDEYGGSLENRMRYMVETLTAMREIIGSDMPLGIRLKLDDYAERGMNPEEYIETVKRLENLHLVDYINFTGGDHRHHHGPMPRPDGEWLPLLEEMRKHTRLTLLHAGRITTPEMAESVLSRGLCDIVCMTKSHICDPHFTRKVFEGRIDDIRFCTRCLQSCHGKMDQMTCVYNPFTKREAEWGELKPTSVKRRIVVIGAGPAGMEAALTAALRGHDVTVFEKSGRVGGQVLTGAGSPLRKLWGRIAEFYERQSRKGLFTVRLNTEATPDLVEAERPDAVVIATGSRPNRLEIAGGPAALTVHAVIDEGAANQARRVVVLDREGLNRALVAVDYLSARGIEVEFVSAFAEASPAVEGMMRGEMHEQLKARGVRFKVGEDVEGWAGAGRLILRSILTAEERTLVGIDVVVGAVGSTAVASLGVALRGRVPELHVIGDANTPQTVEAATYQGARIGRLL